MIIGDEEKAAHYQRLYDVRQRQFDKLFWDDKRGLWFDYHIKEKKRDTRFYVSAIVPMFTECHGVTTPQKEYKVRRVLEYIEVRICFYCLVKINFQCLFIFIYYSYSYF